jgi:epoxyqueuosine reductase
MLEKEQKMSIKEEIIAIARGIGIDKVGFTLRQRLENAPPSGDLGYVLPSAKSAVSLAVALEKPAIRAYLSKEDQIAHVRDHKLSYVKLVDAAQAIAELLRKRGYEAVSPWPNIEYRENMPYMAMVPPVSHRYIACAAGLGWLGWSGNLIMPEYGAAVSLWSPRRNWSRTRWSRGTFAANATCARWRAPVGSSRRTTRLNS